MERVEGTDIDAARLKKGKNTEEELMPGYLRRSCEKFPLSQFAQSASTDSKRLFHVYGTARA